MALHDQAERRADIRASRNTFAKSLGRSMMHSPGHDRRPSRPSTDSTPRRLARWLLRGAVVAMTIAVAGRMEHELDSVSLGRVALAAGIGAVAGLLAIGIRFAPRDDVLHSRALDWLLLGPWTILFILGLWWLEEALEAGPLRAILAAAAATLGSVLLTLSGVMLQRLAAR
jgi:hypothetical protein